MEPHTRTPPPTTSALDLDADMVGQVPAPVTHPADAQVKPPGGLVTRHAATQDEFRKEFGSSMLDPDDPPPQAA